MPAHGEAAQRRRVHTASTVRRQGKLCPVTGRLLGESDGVVDKDLRIEIKDWQLRRAMNKARPGSSDGAGPENAEDDLSSDLYEF